MSAEQQLVKIHWNNELRLLPCNLNSYQELIQQCAARFELPAANLVLSYQDDCSDTITVTTDADLQAALSCFSQSKVRPKFTLVKKENSTNSALPTLPAGPKMPIPFHPKMVHPCFAARRHLACRAIHQATAAQPSAPAPAPVPAPQAPKVQQPKTEAEKKAEKQQKKQALRLQKLAGLKATRIVRLRWKEPEVSASSASSTQEEETKKPIKNFKGCYFGVEWKKRALTFDCGRGLKSLWFLRQLKDGDVVLSSMICPNRFLRMNKTGVIEFNTGENGPWARWNVLNSETGEKLNNVDRKLMETLINGSKIRLASKTNVGKFIGQTKKEQQEQMMATGTPEGLVFTVEVVEALKAHQVVKLCCDGVTLIDPKTEDKEKKEKKAKKLEEAKQKKEKNNSEAEEETKKAPKIAKVPIVKKKN